MAEVADAMELSEEGVWALTYRALKSFRKHHETLCATGFGEVFTIFQTHAGGNFDSGFHRIGDGFRPGTLTGIAGENGQGLFAIGTGGDLRHYWQTSTTSGFTGPLSLGGQLA